MLEIIPSILPKNYEDLKNKIALVRGAVGLVQIDICDGIFTSSTTWPFLSKSGGEEFSQNNLDEHFKKVLNEEEGMPFWEDMDFELDLLVTDAVENFDIYTKLGPKKIIFHIEAVGEFGEFKNFLEGTDAYIRDSIEFGVALNPSTPFETIFPLLSLVDFVQFMGNDKIGFHGVELDRSVLDRVKIFKEIYPDIKVSVDIGVNMKTAPSLVKSGTDRLVIGSAIWNADDIIGRIEEFKNL